MGFSYGFSWQRRHISLLISFEGQSFEAKIMPKTLKCVLINFRWAEKFNRIEKKSQLTVFIYFDSTTSILIYKLASGIPNWKAYMYLNIINRATPCGLSSTPSLSFPLLHTKLKGKPKRIRSVLSDYHNSNGRTLKVLFPAVLYINTDWGVINQVYYAHTCYVFKNCLWRDAVAPLSDRLNGVPLGRKINCVWSYTLYNPSFDAAPHCLWIVFAKELRTATQRIGDGVGFIFR